MARQAVLHRALYEGVSEPWGQEVLEPVHEARVAVVVELALRDGRSLVQRTIDERRAVESDDPAELARAMSAALAAVVDEIGGVVEKAAVESSTDR